jgi:hypothetical protein
MDIVKVEHRKGGANMKQRYTSSSIKKYEVDSVNDRRIQNMQVDIQLLNV